jgi:hypothetical protein
VQGLGSISGLVSDCFPILARSQVLSFVPAQTFFGEERNSINEGDIAASLTGD